MSYKRLLPNKCSIERKTVILNDYSHAKQSWATVYVNVPCRLDKIGNFTSTLSQTPTGQTSRNEFVGFFLPDQDIRTGDRFKLNNTTTYLYVTPSLDVYDSKELHHKEIFCSIQEA